MLHHTGIKFPALQRYKYIQFPSVVIYSSLFSMKVATKIIITVKKKDCNCCLPSEQFFSVSDKRCTVHEIMRIKLYVYVHVIVSLL